MDDTTSAPDQRERLTTIEIVLMAGAILAIALLALVVIAAI